VQWIKQLVGGFLPRSNVFDSSPLRVGCVVGKVTLGQISIQVLQLAPASILPTVFHTHSFIYHRRYITLAVDGVFSPLNAELSRICHLLALLGARHILHVSRMGVVLQIGRSVRFHVIKICTSTNSQPQRLM